MKKKYKRVGFTAAQSAELWDRWQKGEGLTSIGRALGKPSSCIFNHIRPSGGIRPRPGPRSRLALTLAEREEISRGLVAERSFRSIASALGRAPSTVSREVNRNGGNRRYRAVVADKRAWKEVLRPKTCKLAMHPRLRQTVARKLKHSWAPEQIAGWLKRTYPDDEAYHVSHETIYRSLFVQARGVLKQGAHRAPTLTAPDTSLPARHGERRQPWPDPGYGLDQGAPGWRRRPGRAWTLGRRFGGWVP